MITLTNPLTTEERLSVVRLLEHDLGNEIHGAVGWEELAITGMKTPEQFLERTRKKRPMEALIHMFHVLTELTQDDELDFVGEDYLNSSRKIISFFEGVRRRGDAKDMSLIIKDFVPFTTKPSVIYFVMKNSIKNAAEAQRGIIPEEQRKVDLEVSCCDFPEQAVYIPDGARDYQRFVGFHFHNTGKEFPKDKPLKDRLTICPPKNSRGFGLYFTGLAARVLRAPVDIQSQGQDTTISFYQPIYPDEEARSSR